MSSPLSQQDLFSDDSSDSQILDNQSQPKQTTTLFLTPNNRLAREFSKPKGQAHQGVFEKHPAYSLANYEQLLWDTLLQQGKFEPCCKKILTNAQIEFIWQEIITNIEPEILNINQTAKLCAKAFDLEAQYCVKDESEFYQDEEKYTVYLKFKSLFEQKLTSLNAICPSQKTNIILQAFKQSYLDIPKNIQTYDLKQIPTIWSNIFDYFKSCDTQIESIELKKKTPTLQQIVACEDIEHEIHEMVSQAYKYMCEFPDKTVALVIHDLATLKPSIEQSIKKIFEPSLLTNTNNEDFSIDDFNITAASTLAQAPIIQAALNALSLNIVNIDTQSLSQFLLSPFFEAKDIDEDSLETNTDINESHFKALAEAKLRDENIQQLNKKQCLFFLNRFSELDAFKSRLDNFFKQLSFQSKKPSLWAKHFEAQLDALNWPGTRVLTSIEHQQVKHWPNCLHELAKFDDLLDDITIGQALSLFTQLVNNTSFHAQTPYSRLQVMGTLEAKGLCFDKTWVMQMDQTSWPSFAKAHPFLPQALQQKYNLPHCSLEREMNYTQELTDCLSTMAHEISFSFSQTKDGQPIHPSKLLPSWEMINATCSSSALNQTIENTKKQIEEKTWTQSSPLDQNVITKLPGSTYYLKTFNHCGFKAFMQYRAKIYALNTSTTGILAFERGNIIHDSLEQFYRLINTQDKLKELEQDKLEELVTPILENCLGAFNKKKLAPLSQTIIDLEFEYLFSLLILFLETEKTRGDFKIHALEDRRTIEIGNIQLNMSIDRIDQLKDGSFYFWDYKSGKTQLKNWFSEPIKDPQLPIYALTQSDQSLIAGIGFAKITPLDLQNNTAYHGIQKDNTIEIAKNLNSVEELYNDKKVRWMEKESLDESLQFWKQSIEHTAIKITQGHHPSQECELCTYCEYLSLCKEKIETPQSSNNDKALNEGLLND